MGRIEITTGDFLKNAGIVGMKYMLDLSEAEENKDYGISEDEQNLWLDKQFAEHVDWTDLAFRAFVKNFGPSSTFQRVLDTIDSILEKIETGNWKTGKEEKEALKYINDKLLSNSYQAGFSNIEMVMEASEVYRDLKKKKLSDKETKEQLKERLEALKDFLEQPLCRETFIMKSAIYTYINRFWDGKCFLLRSNAKKDMRELFEKEFSNPLRNYIVSEHLKAKELCIDCGMPMDTKEKVSIAFMKDMADDLTRKRSAFWNCKVDAWLCPLCAFVYALSPLGFQLFANKFVFININDSVSSLIKANSKKRKANIQAEKEEGERYTVWFARILNTVLLEKTGELFNIQIILRGVRAEDKYMFSIIQMDTLKILKNNAVQKGLAWLGKYPYIKIGNDFLNVHEAVVLNILQYRNQYALLNKLMRALLDTGNGLATAYCVYMIQIWTNRVKQGEETEEIIYMGNSISMRNNGYNLRTDIMRAKGTDKDDCLRGTIYQLLNALSVRDEKKFIDIVIRMYNSSKRLMPDGFVYMLGTREQDKEKFLEYGYAFVLGLQGSHPDNKEEK